MELRTFQIDLDSLEEIKPQQLPFNVEAKEAELEYFARSVIKLGGLLRIPVVERTGIESYRLIEGHFDYLAYLKARELNPDLPDRIRVFIMEKDNSEAVQTQLKALKDLEPSNSNNFKSNDEDNNLKDLQVQVNSLRLYIETELKRIGDSLQPFLNPSKTDVEIKQLLEDLRAEVAELREIIPPKPEKINLLSASRNELLDALIESGMKKQYANAASQAIEYWKDSGRGLTWTNLKKSTKKGDCRITSFGEATYRKLQEIAEIK
ncbi:hypothetical protein NDI52_27590 [Leptolyngbya sp. PL-A3]|uniref:hypothetical protein n=1 Tax=Leptolyngbya sp. PL-A3 TaxID=2933911 RepID=UPI0032986801